MTLQKIHYISIEQQLFEKIFSFQVWALCFGATHNPALSLFFHHHSIGDNLHPLSPLKILFRGKFVLRNEYLLESVQVVLFRVGAKIVIFRKLSARPEPIIPVFRNDLSRFPARGLYPLQHLYQLGHRAKKNELPFKSCKKRCDNLRQSARSAGQL